jgi:hypothetical protein
MVAEVPGHMQNARTVRCDFRPQRVHRLMREPGRLVHLIRPGSLSGSRRGRSLCGGISDTVRRGSHVCRLTPEPFVEKE